MIGYHCDGPDCDTWTTDLWGHHFIKAAYTDEIHIDKSWYFCSMDCCGKFMLANSSPTETL